MSSGIVKFGGRECSGVPSFSYRNPWYYCLPFEPVLYNLVCVCVCVCVCVYRLRRWRSSYTMRR